jgi:hypothetical protein
VRLRHAGGLAVAALLVMPVDAWAEWHFKPFLGFTFEPSTTLVGDVEFAAGVLVPPGEESQSSNVAFGAAVALLGDVFGVEGEWSQAPGFFQARDQTILVSSGAQTFTGSLIVAVPRTIAEYTLRPYVVAGAGVMRLRSEGKAGAQNLFPIQDSLATLDFGGGATGFFNERLGVSWDLRYFRSIGAEETGDPAVTTDGLAKQLSFWRANMALVLRY